ncbi:ubiquitin-conjugating enzyme/RWD-like protein [Dunaliella salina]|uniref:Ubiquitin-conjugating enzyme/RWD-like protein n=1 Tax=Dunaliella salina TaxID=3046 RepID=A0ABQ7GW31_DUNSA|nr:ubiquitin-conjugating enzyme/RWD-like protein [Dunaliella salina]|eukprot:KAF5838822.1 ubiquitin-conjugating enzyme/RWD-like protein [Dunaliella salina]
MACLALALDFATTHEDVASAVAVWQSNMAATATATRAADPSVSMAASPAPGKNRTQAQQTPSRDTAHGNPPRPSSSSRGGGAAAAAAAAAAPSNQAATAATAGAAAGATGPTAQKAAAPPCKPAEAAAAYCAALRPHQFVERPLVVDHYFRKVMGGGGGQTSASGGEVMRKRLRRIAQEIGTLSTSLPLDYESSIAVAVDETQLDVLRVLCLPSPETPYGCGCFVFDVLLPAEYPQLPPKVQFLTTGGGRVRFNPNLYENGKVCLSLLGTWSGPSWHPDTSTLLQVLLSLQAMVFCPDPYFNEPGYEASLNSAAGKRESCMYNDHVRLHTLEVAILPALRALSSAAAPQGLPQGAEDAGPSHPQQLGGTAPSLHPPHAPEASASAPASQGSASCQHSAQHQRRFTGSLPGMQTFEGAIAAHFKNKRYQLPAIWDRWSLEFQGSQSMPKAAMQSAVATAKQHLAAIPD